METARNNDPHGARSSPRDGTRTRADPRGLTCLHAPAAARFDLIFVHGLRGDAQDTWCKDRDPSTFWPKEWLPYETGFENVRVHSFGYSSESSPVGEETGASVRGVGQALLQAVSACEGIRGSETKIVLIGHGIGGLITKQMVLLGRYDERRRAVTERVAGMAFLGTPHDGMEGWRMIGRPRVLAGRYKGLTQDLDRGSSALRTMNAEFRHAATRLHVVSFYETRKTRVWGRSVMVVDPVSSVVRYAHEKQIPLKGTHWTICRFDTPTSLDYVAIRDALAEMLQDM